MRVLTVVGARPQFIKSGVVSDALTAMGHQEFLLHTGQHYDEEMSAKLFQELELKKPDFHNSLVSHEPSLQLAEMLQGIHHAIKDCQPDILLVYGDTTSTLAGALAANKSGIKLAHIESGLRSFNRKMPEEVNRIITDQLSDICFCPDEKSMAQLRAEKVNAQLIISGDVMLDVQNKFIDKCEDVDLPANNIEALLTLHRAENTQNEEALNEIFKALEALDISVLFPVHPRIKTWVKECAVPQNVQLCAPLSYLQMLKALKQCSYVFTDSGGLQKEAYWLQKPCMTLRSETEWTDTLIESWNQLCPPKASEIVEKFKNHKTGLWKPLYGDGQAAKRIAEQL